MYVCIYTYLYVFICISICIHVCVMFLHTQTPLPISAPSPGGRRALSGRPRREPGHDLRSEYPSSKDPNPKDERNHKNWGYIPKPIKIPIMDHESVKGHLVLKENLGHLLRWTQKRDPSSKNLKVTLPQCFETSTRFLGPNT